MTNHNLAIDHKHFMNQAHLHELVATMYLCKAKQAQLRQVQFSEDLSLLLSDSSESNTLTRLLKEQTDSRNKLGRLLMKIISHSDSPEQVFQLFNSLSNGIGLNPTAPHDIQIDDIATNDLAANDLEDVEGKTEQDMINTLEPTEALVNIEHSPRKQEQEQEQEQEQAHLDLETKTPEHLATDDVNPKASVTPIKNQMVAEVVGMIELLPSETQKMPSDEDLMKSLYLPATDTADTKEAYTEPSIADLLLKDLAESPVRSISDQAEFAQQFKHVQRWSDINKLKMWTVLSEPLREQGLKYLSARLNYLQTLPYDSRPEHAQGEGAYRACKNQLKGAAKSLTIGGLTVDSRLMAKDWLKKAQKRYDILVNSLRLHLDHSDLPLEQKDQSHSTEAVIGYDDFIQQPEVIKLQEAMNAQNEACIKSEVHNVVKANICEYDDPRLGYLLAYLSQYSKIFGGRANQALRSNISRYTKIRQDLNETDEVRQDSNMSVETGLIPAAEVEAQDKAEVEVQELAEDQDKAEAEVQELAEDQDKAEAEVQELAEAQDKAEFEVQEFAEAQDKAEVKVQELAEDQDEAEFNAVKLALPPVGSMQRLLLKRAQVMASATNKRLSKKQKLKAKKRKGKK